MKISIDCWGTLIKSSPDFVRAKNQMIKKLFDVKQEWIDACFDLTKKQLNNIIEVTGWQPEQDIAFRLLLTKLAGRIVDASEIDGFKQEYQMLAMHNSPQIFSEETIEYVKKLKELGDLYISSNTIFVKGFVLKKTLEDHDILKCFKGFAFSNEMKFSKPHKLMYCGSNFHIGDNETTDGEGAFLAGSQPIIINSNNKTIKDAYDFIKQNG